MTHVKICGLTREADLDCAVVAGADMVGFVSEVPIKTPRELSTARAAELAERAPVSVTSVLVMMPETPVRGAELVEQVGPDAVQVHGCSPDEVATLTGKIDARLFAAVDATDPNVVAYAETADSLVLDSTDEHGAGGTGETHDWERARDVVDETDVPVLLAGGLTPANVTEAVDTVRPFGVDVSSGIEHSGGVKDHDALWQFVERASTARTVWP